jgi:hypothetical protein
LTNSSFHGLSLGIPRNGLVKCARELAGISDREKRFGHQRSISKLMIPPRTLPRMVDLPLERMPYW